MLLGELAALATAGLWAVASLLFTAAARRRGSFALNVVRLSGALLILSAVLFATRGLSWAPGAGAQQLGILAVSGWVGLTLGDWAYFGAFVAVGPRLTTLLMTLAPPFTTLIAWLWLGEVLPPLAFVGMAVTLVGVAWVVAERGATPIPRGARIRGVLLASLGSLGQALGLVLSKMGMGETVDPLPATAIRMAAAVAGVWVLAVATGRAGDAGRLLRDPRARYAAAGATIVGPVLGVWLSLVAVRLTETGIAATLMATTPVLILPLVRVVYGERITRRAVGGALVAVAGVSLLFLR